MKPIDRTVTEPWHKNRREELDWLRVLAFGLLIFYHLGMLYVADWGWHYKSSYSSEFLQNIMLWSGEWRMSLIFLISGVAVSYLLQNINYWRFFLTRHSKIFLPLIVGMTVVVVPQVYIEMSTNAYIPEVNYIDFWLFYLNLHDLRFSEETLVNEISLTWNHLWFLMYIFSYSILLWLLYPLINLRKIRPFWYWLGEHIPLWILVAGPIIVFYIFARSLWHAYPVNHAFVDDWYNHAKSLTCFILGFALVRSTRLWVSLSSFRWPTLISALMTYAYILFDFNRGGLSSGNPSFDWLISHISSLIWAANSWLWLLTIIAWAQHRLNFSNPYLRYLNNGVYCFYIFHQTIIIVAAYLLAPFKLGAVLEPLLILIATIAFCWLAYELIKHVPLVSALFGVKRVAKRNKLQEKRA